MAVTSVIFYRFTLTEVEPRQDAMVHLQSSQQQVSLNTNDPSVVAKGPKIVSFHLIARV